MNNRAETLRRGETTMSSKVYFTDARARSGNNMRDKLTALFDAVGAAEVVAKKDLVAIKIHWGERGNLAYLPPPITAAIADKVRDAGGVPFITDTTTLYAGSRRNAPDNLMTAYSNGFSPSTIGAPAIIADGLFGDDYVKVDIDGCHFKECKIASGIYRAQALISLAHFKGHGGTGFGGTIKNIGMGCSAASGKQNQHSDVKPKISLKKCVGCGSCMKKCPTDAISFNEDHKAVIDRALCIGCAECTVTCRFEAIAVSWKSDLKLMMEKMAEYATAALKNKAGKCVFFNAIIKVSPDCDCFDFNDIPIVPDIGIVASKDPVAVDQAAVDLVNSAPGIAASALGDNYSSDDKFRALHKVDWRHQLDHAIKLGAGSRDYELINIDK